MKKYLVSVERASVVDFLVEAESFEDAEEIAVNQLAINYDWSTQQAEFAAVYSEENKDAER